MGSPSRRLTNPITRCRDQPHYGYVGTDDGRGTDPVDLERVSFNPVVEPLMSTGGPSRWPRRLQAGRRADGRPSTRLPHGETPWSHATCTTWGARRLGDGDVLDGDGVGEVATGTCGDRLVGIERKLTASSLPCRNRSHRSFQMSARERVQRGDQSTARAPSSGDELDPDLLAGVARRDRRRGRVAPGAITVASRSDGGAAGSNWRPPPLKGARDDEG
jgi:hypothetical protein